jgi:hypothetical protein
MDAEDTGAEVLPDVQELQVERSGESGKGNSREHRRFPERELSERLKYLHMQFVLREVIDESASSEVADELHLQVRESE